MAGWLWRVTREGNSLRQRDDTEFACETWRFQPAKKSGNMDSVVTRIFWLKFLRK